MFKLGNVVRIKSQNICGVVSNYMYSDMDSLPEYSLISTDGRPFRARSSDLEFITASIDEYINSYYVGVA